MIDTAKRNKQLTMALDNLISASFTDDELSRMDRAMSEIERVIRDKPGNGKRGDLPKTV
jgi:hypothetical protein